jgi:hypothetical protein
MASAPADSSRPAYRTHPPMEVALRLPITGTVTAAFTASRSAR